MLFLFIFCVLLVSKYSADIDNILIYSTKVLPDAHYNGGHKYAFYCKSDDSKSDTKWNLSIAGCHHCAVDPIANLTTMQRIGPTKAITVLALKKEDF